MCGIDALDENVDKDALYDLILDVFYEPVES